MWLLLLIVIFCLITGFSDNNVKIKDPNLEQVIREALDKPQGQLTVKEIERIRELDAENRGVKTLKGLEKVTNLNKWDLSNNQLKNIEGLNNLVTVKELDLSKNKLKNVNGLESLNKVKELYLNNNQLTAVDGLKNLSSSVITLALDNNQLSNIYGLIGLSRVQQLYLNDNQLTNIEGLKNLTITDYIVLHENKLKNVAGLSSLTKVNELDLSNNQLRDISGLNNLKEIEELYLDNNQLYTINHLNGEYTTLAQKNKKLIKQLQEISEHNFRDDYNKYVKSNKNYFTFQQFGYGTSRKEIEKVLSTPVVKEQSRVTYNDNQILIVYRENKVIAIKMQSDEYKTAQGIKVGDSVEKVKAAYGPADSFRQLYKNKAHLIYKVKMDSDEIDFLRMLFKIAEEKVAFIILEGVKRHNY